MSASKVRQGQVYVEIGADPRKFFSTIGKVQSRIGSMGRGIAAAGAGVGGLGLSMAAPFIASVREGARFQDTLLAIGASTGATDAELQRVRDSAMQMSSALSIGPTEAAGAFLELMKAGMSLEDVLGGAGQAAIEFAAVGGIDVAQAAVVMSDAMNVFKVSADVAANAMSSAADASSTSIAEMAQAFSMSSAVAGLANQSIGDLSATLAILANNGIKGSDAGTSVKTMLLKLMAPTDEAVGALAKLSLTTKSFRDADGNMLPMVEIIRTLTGSMGKLDKEAQHDALRKIFGTDAIRAAAILARVGPEGFDKMVDAMGNALPISAKYMKIMGGLSGAGLALKAAMQRMAIAITTAVAPAIMKVVPILKGLLNGLTLLARNNGPALDMFLKIGLAAVAMGGTLIGLGVSLQLVAFSMGGIGTAAKILLAPLAMVMGGVLGVGGAFASAVPGVIALANAAGASIISFGSVTVSAMAGVGASVARSMVLAGSSIVGFAGSALAPLARFGAVMGGVFQAQFSIARSVGTGLVKSFSFAFYEMVASVGPLRSALHGISGLVVAVAADMSRALGSAASAMAPMAGGLAAVARSVMAWGTATAAGVATYVSAIATAIAATVAGKAKMVAAWASELVAPIVAWATATSAQVARYAQSVAAAVAATVAGAVRMAGAWIATAMPATAAWAAGAAASMARYVASVAVAAAATVAGALRIGAAWVVGGMPGLLSFVGASVAALAGYLGAAAMAVAGTIASAAAIGAAWLAPLAPIVAIGAAIAVAGAVAASFGGTIKGALAGVGGAVATAAEAIGGGFNTAVADGSVVFADLSATAMTTFSGISDAISSGDLAGAMDVLWAGLVAGWLRGTEAIMGYVDPWVSAFQNVFTDIGVGVAVAWDYIYTNSVALLNTMGAFIFGYFDNIANGVMATFDNLVAGIQIAWTRVKGFITGAKDTKDRVKEIKDKNAARAEQRQHDRPGINARKEKASKENAKAETDRQGREDAMVEDGENTKAGRDTENKTRADQRRAETLAAEGNVQGKAKKADSKKQSQNTGDTLNRQMESATSLDELRTIAEQMHAMHAAGKITQDQMDTFQGKADVAAERIQEQESGVISDAERAASAAGNDVAQNKSEVAGTFSAAAVSGMGFGGGLAERTAVAAEKTATHTGKLAEQGAAEVGE